MKSKHMKGTPFDAKVCDAIRHHIGERLVLEVKRGKAFEDRDAALAEIAEIESRDCREYGELCRRHSEAVQAIETLGKSVKWHQNQVDELVEKADEPQLDFMYDPPEEPATKQLKLAGVAPVGKPGRPRPEGPDPSLGDGVDEHLRASVNELDCREDIKGKLIDAGLTTVGRVAAVLDDDKQDLREVLNCGENIASEIKKAVKQYRTKHRRAAHDVEATA